MKNTRTEFDYKRYLGSSCGLLFVNILVIAGTIEFRKIEYILCLIVMAYYTAKFYKMLMNNFGEKYSIESGYIKIKRGGKISDIEIPKRCTLVVSYGDDGPLPMRYQIHDTMYSHYCINRKWCAVSIVKDMDYNELWSRIIGSHHKYMFPELLKYLFSSKYVYSFLLDYDSLKKLTSQTDYTILVPKEIYLKISDDVASYKCMIY